jgi:hypothetical protein
MKKLARAKSIARWTAWVLAALLPLIWAASLWGTCYGSFRAGPNGLQFGGLVGEGTIGFGLDLKGGLPSSFVATRATPTWPREWLLHAGGSNGMAGVTVPLWMPWLAAIGASIWFFRDHQREKMRRIIGRCRACGYDRSGLAESAPCPECGAAPTHQ